MPPKVRPGESLADKSRAYAIALAARTTSRCVIVGARRGVEPTTVPFFAPRTQSHVHGMGPSVAASYGASFFMEGLTK